jgi:hypothetical protein
MMLLRTQLAAELPNLVEVDGQPAADGVHPLWTIPAPVWHDVIGKFLDDPRDVARLGATCRIGRLLAHTLEPCSPMPLPLPRLGVAALAAAVASWPNLKFAAGCRDAATLDQLEPVNGLHTVALEGMAGMLSSDEALPTLRSAKAVAFTDCQQLARCGSLGPVLSVGDGHTVVLRCRPP